jgi:nucleoid-associated protein YgaU
MARSQQRQTQGELKALQSSQVALAAERDRLSAELASLKDKSFTLDERLRTSNTTLKEEQDRAASLTERLSAALKDRSSLAGLTESQRREIEGITAALNDAQAKVARFMGARGIYTVQEGDSLSAIALYFYRNANRWPGILASNRHLINHPDLIFPAMVLIIPK